jgi:hypothetical protein
MRGHTQRFRFAGSRHSTLCSTEQEFAMRYRPYVENSGGFRLESAATGEASRRVNQRPHRCRTWAPPRTKPDWENSRRRLNTRAPLLQ